MFFIYICSQTGGYLCFRTVCLCGRSHRFGLRRVENQSVDMFGVFQLMRKPDRQQAAFIESTVCKQSNFRMHTPLTAKHIVKMMSISMLADCTIQSFKQRILQVLQPDSGQGFIINFRLFRILQDDGRKLFMIAYQNKFVNGIFPIFSPGTKNAQ